MVREMRSNGMVGFGAGPGLPGLLAGPSAAHLLGTKAGCIKRRKRALSVLQSSTYMSLFGRGTNDKYNLFKSSVLVRLDYLTVLTAYSLESCWYTLFIGLPRYPAIGDKLKS